MEKFLESMIIHQLKENGIDEIIKILLWNLYRKLLKKE